jgi:DNA polymerase IV
MRTNSQTKILHVDFNSFFASAEQQANPFLRGKSIGVGGKVGTKGIIAAASREAKMHGVKTAMSAWEAQLTDPTIMVMSGDSKKYGEFSSRLRDILKRQGGIVEPYSIDEAFLDVTDVAHDWLDTLAIALRIREAVEQEIGTFVSVSIGIGPNRLLAKMASDAEKPNGLTLVYPSEKEKFEFLETRSLDDIPGIGTRILRRLVELGIGSIKQLRATDLPFLIQHFKQYGPFLYNSSRGIDSTPVSDYESLEKSIGHSYTLPYHTQDMSVVRRTLLSLSDRVGWRLRKRGLVARAYTAIVRFSDLKVVAQQGQLSAPTGNGYDLYQNAWNIIQHQVTHNETRVATGARSVRLIGIVARKLLPSHMQYTLDTQKQKHQSLMPWLDQIQMRYGKRSWLRASLLPTELKERINGLKLDHMD